MIYPTPTQLRLNLSLRFNTYLAQLPREWPEQSRKEAFTQRIPTTIRAPKEHVSHLLSSLG